MADTAKKMFAADPIGVDLDARTVTHYVTRPTVDADDEVLLPRGADISRFRQTGTVFDVHEYSSTAVVGRCMEMKVSDDGIIATTRFSPRPPSLPEAVEWWPDSLLWLYKVGDIRGWSVGFRPIESRMPSKRDKEMWGEQVRRVHTRYQLLEYSVAPLPSNADALTLAQRGILSGRLAKQLNDNKKIELKLEAAPVAPAAPIKRTIHVFEPPLMPIRPPDYALMVRRAFAKAAGRICHE